MEISEILSIWIRKLMPHLAKDLKLAQIRQSPENFVIKIFFLSLIFSLNVSVISFVVLLKNNITIWTIPLFFIFIFLFMVIFLQIPKIFIAQIKQEIESDIFVPSRMLLTLLESGSSIITALERVSYTNAKSSKYFGKIATEIYLGKSLSDAIDEAIKYTPSDSFRRILQPIRRSLMAGTDVRKSLLEVLDDMMAEKVIEIEKYEKKLGAISLFYMIFGVIIPAIFTIVVVVVMSVIGLSVSFFPFLFILLLLLIILQFGFIKIFQRIRPMTMM